MRFFKLYLVAVLAEACAPAPSSMPEPRPASLPAPASSDPTPSSPPTAAIVKAAEEMEARAAALQAAVQALRRP